MVTCAINHLITRGSTLWLSTERNNGGNGAMVLDQVISVCRDVLRLLRGGHGRGELDWPRIAYHSIADDVAM